MSNGKVGLGKRRLNKIQRYLDEQYPDLVDIDVVFVVEGFRISRKNKTIGIWTLVSEEDPDLKIPVKIPISEMEESAAGKVVDVLKSMAGPALFLLLMKLLQTSSDVRVCPVTSDVWSDNDLFDMM